MTWNNTTKNTSSLTNQPFGDAGETWDMATFTWDNSNPATWNRPTMAYSNQTKNISTETNQPKS